MNKLPEINGQTIVDTYRGEIYIPNSLIQNLDILHDDMYNSNMDIVLVIDGKEGVGKSYDGRLIGTYFAHLSKVKFGVENVHFNSTDYIEASEKGKQFQINILDESRQVLNKKRSMSGQNVMFTNWLSENRDKRQVHILILPAVHDLDTYVALWRMSIMIHKIKTHKTSIQSKAGFKLTRGGFKVYANNHELQSVLFNRVKYGRYAYPKINKGRGTIRYVEVFTTKELKEYNDKKKTKREEKYKEKETKTDTKYKKENELLKHRCLEVHGETLKGLSEVLGLDRSSLGKQMVKYKEKERKRA